MSALKEFANFINLNTATLAATYARFLEESGGGYETFPLDSRMASARKLLKAVTEACESQTSTPLASLFSGPTDGSPRRWAANIEPPQPLIEIECLGQTLTPVVPSLDAGKFLWQILSDVRAAVLPTMADVLAVPLHRDVTERKQVEEELTLQRDLLQALMDSSPDYVFFKDAESRLIKTNKAHVQLLGLASPEEAIGKTDFDLFPGEDAQKFYDEEQQIIRSGQPIVDRVGRTPDSEGNLLWLSETKMPMRDETGQVIGLVGIARDITERKQAEEALRENEALYQSLVDALPQNVYRVDQEGRIIFGNKAYLAGLGMTLEECLGKTAYDFFPKELADEYTADDKRVMQTGEVFDTVEAHQSPTADEMTYVRVMKTPVRDFEGEIVGVQGIFWDVTERKRMEEALAHERDLLQALMDNSPDYLFFKDRESRFIRTNEAHAQLLLGLADPQEAVGKTDFDLFPGEDPQRFYDEEQHIMQSREPVVGREWSLPSPGEGGETVWLSEHKIPMVDKTGQVIGLVGIGRDITGRKHEEEAAARRAAELETVAQVGTAATTILEVGKLLQEVVDLTKNRFSLYHAHIYLLNEAEDAVVLAAGAGDVGRQMVAEGWRIPLDQEQSLVVRAVRSRQGVIFNDVHQTSGWLPNPLLPDTCSEMAVPMIVGDQVLGVLDVQSDEVDHFTDEDVHIQTTLAAQIAAALQNANLHGQTQDALAQTEALYTGSDRVVRAETMDEVLQALVESTALQRLDRASITFFNRPWENEFPEEATVVAAWERSGEEPRASVGTRYPMAQFPVIEMVSRSQPAIFHDITTDERVNEPMRALLLDRLGMRGLLLWPLVIGGQWLGFLSGQASTAIGINESEIRQIDSLTDQASAVIHSIRLLEQARQTSLLLGERVKELNCLNDIGREMEETPPVPSLLQWVTERIPPAMQYPDLCVVAIEYDGQVYGVAEAVELPCQMVHGLYIGGEVMGRVYIAYTEKRDFLDEESALLGAIATRLSGYIENRRLLEHTQRRAGREQTIREITEKMRGAISLEELVKTAAEELGQRFSAEYALVELGTDASETYSDQHTNGRE